MAARSNGWTILKVALDIEADPHGFVPASRYPSAVIEGMVVRGLLEEWTLDRWQVGLTMAGHDLLAESRGEPTFEELKRLLREDRERAEKRREEDRP